MAEHPTRSDLLASKRFAFPRLLKCASRNPASSSYIFSVLQILIGMAISKRSFEDIKEALSVEMELLSSLVYRSKNQHKSSLVLRKMAHLKRLLRISAMRPLAKDRILECCKRLYLASSSDLGMGFFIPLNLCVLAISARVFYLVSSCQAEFPKTKIDEIFSKLDQQGDR